MNVVNSKQTTIVLMDTLRTRYGHVTDTLRTRYLIVNGSYMDGKCI